MKKNLLKLSILLSFCLSASAQNQATTEFFVAPAGTVTAGNQTSIWLHVLNPSDREVSWTFPAKMDCRLVSSRLTRNSALDMRQATEVGQVAIAPGAFVRREYLLTIPADFEGQVFVEFPSRGMNRVVLNVQATAVQAAKTEKIKKTALALFIQEGEMQDMDQAYDSGHFFKEHISGYEPMYLIGGSKSPAVKFQLSFKYQLLNSRGALAKHAPALTGFHLAYTQTSLWDFNGPSSPFFDTSYKPEFLYSRERVIGGNPSDWFRLDLQGGLQHESNGKGGVDSRALSIAYLRPTFFFGQDDGLQLTLQPRVWTYLGSLSDNPDISDYRGFGDLRAIVGWKRGLELSALGRIGEYGEHGSLQLDLTYPLMRLVSNSFTIYLDVQYFTGYGESLLRYNRESSGLRVGFSIYR